MPLSQLSAKLHELGLSHDAAILAGGCGSRMGGQDKGLVPFLGRPMIAHVVDLLRPLASGQEVLINCNRNQSGYQAISPRICTDITPDFPGPLAGIQAILSNSSADLLFILPCDTPLVDASIIDKLVSGIVQQDVPVDTLKPVALICSQHKHPLHCCLPRRYLELVDQAINSGHQKLTRWFDDNDTVWVDTPNDTSLSNVNTTSELHSLSTASHQL